MGGDPKPVGKPRTPTRQIDKSATAKACLEWRECPCGKPSAEGHHVLARGVGGGDVAGNLLPLCRPCHALIEAEDDKTRRMVGRWVKKHRPDTILYVKGKLGDVAGRDWLKRRLFLTVK